MRTEKVARYVLPLVQAVVGIEWLRAGWEKITSGDFPAGMANTLATFAAHNPTGWYRDFLTGTAIPNGTTFGYLIEWGELLAGIGLIVAAAALMVWAAGALAVAAQAVSGFALLAGAFMSWNFWLAAGWMSASTDSANYVMGLIQVVLLGGAIAVLVTAWRARTPAMKAVVLAHPGKPSIGPA